MILNRNRLTGFALSHFDVSIETASALAAVYCKKLLLQQEDGKKITLIDTQMFCHNLLEAVYKSKYAKEDDIDNYIGSMYEMLASYRLKETDEPQKLEITVVDD